MMTVVIAGGSQTRQFVRSRSFGVKELVEKDGRVPCSCRTDLSIKYQIDAQLAVHRESQRSHPCGLFVGIASLAGSGLRKFRGLIMHKVSSRLP